MVAGDNDHQNAGGRQKDELDLIEHLAVAGDGGGDADVAREFGEQVRGVLGAGVERTLVEQLFAEPGELGGEDAAGEVGPGELAESLGGGNAAGGGVGLVEVAVVGELPAMMLRMVAALRPSLRRRAMMREATGSPVSM